MGRRKGDFIVSSAGASVRLRLHVRPGAEEDRVGAVEPWRGSLRVDVRAKPDRGEANEAVVRLLAEALGVPTSGVRIEHGATSRDKTVQVVGIDERAVRDALGGSP